MPPLSVEPLQAVQQASAQPVRTTCPYCGVGCGLLASPDPAGGFQIAGDPHHPANFGRLCSKGAALGETLDLEGRLLAPEVGGVQVPWNTALDAVSNGLQRIRSQFGPEAIGFYVSGQLLTEDYYVANKLMKGFIGSANIDTNSRLCMSSAVSGHKRAFGADAVPGCYEDLELADLVLLVGSNTAWCHPVLYQRIVAAKSRSPNLRVVVIDPRRTATCDIADLHLPIAPGTDAVLFNGLLAHLARAGAIDRRFVTEHTLGFAEALAEARRTAPNVGSVAAALEVPVKSVETLYRWFTTTDRVVTAFSQGINQSSSGTDKVNAIMNCHLATGRIGRPGMGPFSLTGQPNAMGGREVGGLATQLAAHHVFERPEDWDRVRRFWRAPDLAKRSGLAAVPLFQAVKARRIKAIWIMATNPVVSMPDADAVRAALRECELVIVSDCVRRTDTADTAHILLPAAAWGEKDGTVTNSERRISRQRAFMPVPGEAKPDWWIVTQVARRLGFAEAFPYEAAADIFQEHAALSAFENNGDRVFNLGGLVGLAADQYDALQPIQWPVTPDAPEGTTRLFASEQFPTEDRRARFVAVIPRAPASEPIPSAPFVMNSGRIRDQWHTMTRTGKTPRLMTHSPEPYAELHPRDALTLGIDDGAWVRVRGHTGEMVLRARISDGQRPGSVFVPIHWNGQTAGAARVGACIAVAVDPISGQPELKHGPVTVERYQPAWEAEILTQMPVTSSDTTAWVAIRERAGWRTRLTGEVPRDQPEAWLRSLLGMNGAFECMDTGDTVTRKYRAAFLKNGELRAYAAVNHAAEALPLEWLRTLIGQGPLSAADQHMLLSGPIAGDQQPDPIVCACFGIGAGKIAKAVAEQGLRTAAEIGAALRAGTQCGSCLPEIRLLLAKSPRNGAAPTVGLP